MRKSPAEERSPVRVQGFGSNVVLNIIIINLFHELVVLLKTMDAKQASTDSQYVTWKTKGFLKIQLDATMSWF